MSEAGMDRFAGLAAMGGGLLRMIAVFIAATKIADASLQQVYFATDFASHLTKRPRLSSRPLAVLYRSRSVSDRSGLGCRRERQRVVGWDGRAGICIAL